MPPVRTSTAAPLQVAGSTGPRASAASFAPSFAGAAQGLSQVPGALAAVAGARKQRKAAGAEFAREQAINAKKKFEADQKFRQTEAANDLDAWRRDWSSNKDSLNLSPEDAEAQMEKAISETVAKRGLTGDFERDFRGKSGGWKNSMMEDFEVGRENKRIDDASLRLTQAVNEANQRFFNTGDSEFLVGSRDDLHRNVENLFEGMPVRIQKQKTAIDTVVAKSLISVDPEIGEQFVRESKYIDPVTRENMLEAAKNAFTAYNYQERLDMDALADKHVGEVLNGKPVNRLTEDAFKMVFNDREGAAKFAVYERKMDINEMAAGVIGVYSGTNAANISEVVKKAANSKDPKVEAAMKIAADHLAKEANGMRTNPVRYQNNGLPALVEANATLIQAAQAHDANPTEASVIALQAAQTEVNDIRLSYQGMGDSPYHLNLSSHLHSLLDNSEAKQYADDILNANPADVLDKWKEIMASYPDEKHQWIVFEDIAAQGLKFEHIMSFFVKDEHFAHTFISAQRLRADQKSVLTDDKRAQFASVIREHPMYQAWVQASYDAGARPEYVASGANSLINYAEEINRRGEADMDEATKIAVENVFGWMHVFDTGNGTVALDTRKVLPESIEVLEEFLPDALSVLELKDINPVQFEMVTEGFNVKDRERYIQDVLSVQGQVWLAMDRDGKSVVLMGREGPGGDQFVINDKDGNPYRIHVDDPPVRTPFRPETPWREPLRANRFGDPSTRSNWPFAAPAARIGPTMQQMQESAKTIEQVY